MRGAGGHVVAVLQGCGEGVLKGGEGGLRPPASCGGEEAKPPSRQPEATCAALLSLLLFCVLQPLTSPHAHTHVRAHAHTPAPAPAHLHARALGSKALVERVIRLPQRVLAGRVVQRCILPFPHLHGCGGGWRGRMLSSSKGARMGVGAAPKLLVPGLHRCTDGHRLAAAHTLFSWAEKHSSRLGAQALWACAAWLAIEQSCQRSPHLAHAHAGC